MKDTGWGAPPGLSPGERLHPPFPQVWSITYQSWLTFVLLLWACLIWTVRSRHHFAMLCSPFLLLYGIALCSLQYVWGMDLAPELPTRVGFMSLKQLGLEHPKYPCLDLGAKVNPVSPSLSPLVLGWPCSPPVPTAPAHPHLLAAAAAVRQGEAANKEVPGHPAPGGDHLGLG